MSETGQTNTSNFNLREFANRPLTPGVTASGEAIPAPPAASPQPGFPHVILWPAGTPLAAVGGKWRRLEDGQIEATYDTCEELEVCIFVMQALREAGPVEAEQVQEPSQQQQPALFPVGTNNYYQQ